MLGIACEPVLRGTAVITLLLAERQQLSAVVDLVDSPGVEVGLVDSPGVEVGLVDSPGVEVGLVDNPEVEVVHQVNNLKKISNLLFKYETFARGNTKWRRYLYNTENAYLL